MLQASSLEFKIRLKNIPAKYREPQRAHFYSILEKEKYAKNNYYIFTLRSMILKISTGIFANLQHYQSVVESSFRKS